MPSLPRNVTQDQVVRALIRAGGVEVRGLGKGSHRSVRMPNQASTMLSQDAPFGVK